MSTAQQAAVSFLARYSGLTHHLYQLQLREWFAWCENTGLDPLVGVQRADVELYTRSLGERGLMASFGAVALNPKTECRPVRRRGGPRGGTAAHVPTPVRPPRLPTVSA